MHISLMRPSSYLCILNATSVQPWLYLGTRDVTFVQFCNTLVQLTLLKAVLCAPPVEKIRHIKAWRCIGEGLCTLNYTMTHEPLNEPLNP